VSRRRKEAVTPPQLVQRLLAAAGEGMVLVGGQALAYWVDWYNISERPLPGFLAISNDTDFLTRSAADRDSVQRLASVFQGRVAYPNRRALTALVGQAWRDVDESGEEILNVDVIFEVLGIKTNAVFKRAVPMVMADGAVFKVMHPLDVLYSRLINLYKVPDKQGDKGRMQLGLAILVARAFLRQEALDSPPQEVAAGRSPLQAHVSAIERMAIEDAGRKVASRHGLHVADAIDPHLIPPGPFWTKRWPALQKLMSPGYRGTIKAPNPPA